MWPMYRSMRQSARNNRMVREPIALPAKRWTTTWRTRIELPSCTGNSIVSTDRSGRSKWCCDPGKRTGKPAGRHRADELAVQSVRVPTDGRERRQRLAASQSRPDWQLIGGHNDDVVGACRPFGVPRLATPNWILVSTTDTPPRVPSQGAMTSSVGK